jgi:hypothetical protein
MVFFNLYQLIYLQKSNLLIILDFNIFLNSQFNHFAYRCPLLPAILCTSFNGTMLALSVHSVSLRSFTMDVE